MGPLLLDLDATLIQAHSDKQGATPTYKQGFGFHPLGCWLDRGDGPTGTVQAAAGPADAGPSRLRRRDPRLTDELARRNLAFSIGFDWDQRVQRAILGLPEPAWQPAVDPDGRPRRGTWVAEQRSPGCGPCRCAADRRTRSIQASEAACRVRALPWQPSCRCLAARSGSEVRAYQAGFRANSLRGVGSLYPNLSRTCAACRYPSSSMRSKPSASATRSIRLNAKQT